MMFTRENLTTSSALWSLFLATLVITALFPIAASLWDLTFIDGISSPALARDVVDGFNQQQRTAHAWVTATIDAAYPIAYGLFFAASALRFFPRFPLLALPGLLAIPTDLLEGLVQVLALTEVTDLLSFKAVLTPLKMGLFWIAFAITVAGWLRWLIERVKKSTAE